MANLSITVVSKLDVLCKCLAWISDSFRENERSGTACILFLSGKSCLLKCKIIVQPGLGKQCWPAVVKKSANFPTNSWPSNKYNFVWLARKLGDSVKPYLKSAFGRHDAMTHGGLESQLWSLQPSKHGFSSFISKLLLLVHRELESNGTSMGKMVATTLQQKDCN